MLSLITEAQNKNIKFSSYSTSEGLSNDNVNTICIDSRGFLWAGTWNGINRWDGKQFTVYKHSEKKKNSLVHDFVMGCIEDSKKRLWVYTVYGLSLYRPEIDGFENQKLYNKAFINKIFEDRFHQLWVTGRNDISIYNYEAKTKTTIPFSVDTVADPKSNKVMASVLDADTIWLAMGNGMIRKLNIKTQHSMVCGFNAELKKYASKASCNLLYKDRKGNLWIAYQGLGIVTLDPKKQIIGEYTHSNAPSSIGSNDIYQFYEDSNGQMWIAGINGNLNLFLPKTKSFYRYEPNNNIDFSIKGTSISCITEDCFHNLWIGSHGAGLMCINTYINQFENCNPILPHAQTPINIVCCFYESPDKMIWIGTNDNSLIQYNPQTQETKSYSNIDGSLPKTILDILPATNGKLWLATWGGGLLLFDPNTGKSKTFTNNLKDKNSLSSNYIKSICLDDSLLWIACFGKGVNVMNTRTFTIHNLTNTLNECYSKPLWPSAIYKDSKKRIWISTFDNLYMIDHSKLQTFESKPGDIIINSSLRAFEDKNHHLFIPTHDGLALFNEKSKRFTNVLESFGNHNQISAVTESNDGCLWFTSDNGIFRYSMKKKNLKQFDIKDGLASNSYSSNALLKSSNGCLYFGSVQGFSIINTNKLIENNFPPKIYFTDF
jgi:ligand-binding sensor domain-containing protein